MIHSLQRAACHNALRDTLRFQRRLLELVADPATVVPLTEPALTAFFLAFGPTAGTWIAAKPKTLLDDLTKAIVAAQAERARALTLLDDFDHDTNFDTKLTDSAFIFRFQNPASPLELAVKVLMNNLYEEVFSSSTGFSYGGVTNLTRDGFVRAFVDANADLDVCPVCDRSNDDSNRKGTPPHTVDHFFPKAEYPFLSVHPANFLPACGRCNSTYKGTKKPIGGTENLTDTYHPFEGAMCLSITVNRNTQHSLMVSIEEQIHGSTSRARNYIRVFDMESRWGKREKKIMEWIIEHVSVLYDRLERKQRTISTDKFNEVMDGELVKLFNSLLKFLQSRDGKADNAFLKRAYLVSAKNQPNEKNKLIAAVIPNVNQP